ncbi:MAG: hypothetical protein EB060_00125 [Proteobacteria bacterium]|nr:hypothetical protein [Pseudomonadota bacterium]
MPNVPNPEFDFNGNSEPQRPLPPGVNPFDFDAYDKDPDSPVVNPAVSSPIPKPITVQPPKTDADAEKPIVAAPKAEKKPMSTASWYAVTGTALSATLGGAVGAGVGFLIAGPAGLIPGYTYGTIASEAVIVAVPEVLIAVESLSRALEKNGSDIGAVEWLEARRQEVNGIGSGIVTTIGELRDMIGNGLQFVRDGVGTIVQGRIDGFKENGTAAGVGIGVVAGVGGLLTGGTAVLPIVVGGVALKAADALLPEGYQPLNYLLRTGRDLVEAVDNGGQMMLEKEKDGEEPKLLPKRYEELSKAVELELKGRKISVDKDQLKALVDPIAAEIAKTFPQVKFVVIQGGVIAPNLSKSKRKTSDMSVK